MSTEALRICIGLSIAIGSMIMLSRWWKVHAFISLLLASLLYGIITGQALPTIIASMQTGFGSLLSQIGLLVVLGSILGMLLEKSGGMEVISLSVLRFLGPRKSVSGMTVIGALVGIPVFCDSGFIILSKLIPSIAAKASVPPASLTLGLSSGLYTTHTLVPPTPGPLAAAANFSATNDIGIIMIMGFLVSIPVVIVSFLLAQRLGSKISSAFTQESISASAKFSSGKAFLPLVLPIVLIACSSLFQVLQVNNMLTTVITTLGIPVLALTIGILAALPLLTADQRKPLPLWMVDAMKDAGIILLVTGAGGAFGAVIKGSQLDLILKDFLANSSTYGISFLIVGFVLAALLKTAQGSSTSSIIITSSLLAPLAHLAGVQSPMQVALLIITIGGGAMTVSHVNDSYFWVVSQFGKINSDDALRSHTLLTFFQGITVLLVSVLLFLLL
ncbi:MAG: GntP family permease [Cyclobacteriaceae bacterium]|nr:GntP family permease [Cyclobacteriaceae bacterium]